MRILDIFAQKSLAVSKGIQRLAVKSGQTVDDKTLKVLVEAYMLPVQCLWYRIPNDSKVDMLINKFEKFMPQAITLIAKHGFDNLVVSFRSIYTNLYQVGSGQGRTYRLSIDSFSEFLNKVQQDPKIVVTAKPKPQPKPTITSNSFAQVLKVAENVANKVPQVALVKDKVKDKPKDVKGGFKIVSIGEVAKGDFDGRFFRFLIDDKYVFARLVRIHDAKYHVLLNGKLVAYNIEDVAEVCVYQKAS